MTLGRPRVGIDLRMVEKFQSGLGRYARALAQHIPPLSPEWEFVIIKRPSLALETFSNAQNAREVLVAGCLDHLRNLFSASSIHRLNLDLYHSAHHFLPLGLRVPRVVLTVHDLIWVENAHLTNDGRMGWLKWRANQFYGRFTMRHALSRADEVIAISQHTADRLEARYNKIGDRVTVVHHGVEHAFWSAPQDAPHLNQPPFFFSLGNSKPYKNLHTLLRAFHRLSQKHAEVALVLTGRGDDMPRLLAFAKQLGILDKLRFTGMEPDTAVRQHMRSALALVFPSLIEGYGFPLVEAMATGCPVLTSNIPVVLEIVGEAALSVDPLRDDLMAEIMERLLLDQNLRNKLRQAGAIQVEKFQWSTCAKKTLDVYERLLKRVPGGSF